MIGTQPTGTLPKKSRASAGTPVLSIEPAALPREAAAQFIAVSCSTLETLARTEPLLKPVKVSPGCVAWLVDNLRQYLSTRPTSDLPPPKGCGYGRGGKVLAG